MFSIPVKVVEISGGGEGLPLMTWNPSDVFVWSDDPEDYLFTNTNKTIEGFAAFVRGTHAIVPNQWYIEIKIEDLTSGSYYNYSIGVSSNTFSLSSFYTNLDKVWLAGSSSGIEIGEGEETYNTGDVVYIENNEERKILSSNGTSHLASLEESDVLMFAGNQTSEKLWIGLNGVWLYFTPVALPFSWSQCDPASDTNPVFSNLSSTIYAFSKGGDDGSGGQWVEQLTLLTHTDDLVYTPPTGFSAVSGEATVTYLHVLRDRNLMPISQPTDHAMMGVLGL
jgi:hypothetical protein